MNPEFGPKPYNGNPKQPGGHCSPGGCSDCPNQGTSCK